MWLSLSDGWNKVNNWLPIARPSGPPKLAAVVSMPYTSPSLPVSAISTTMKVDTMKFAAVGTSTRTVSPAGGDDG